MMVAFSGMLVLAVVIGSVSAGCPKKYLKLTANHTMCLPTNNGKRLKINKALQAEVVEKHNKYRENVDPPAANMRAMSWDKRLARVALKWARQCKLGHDLHANRAEPALKGVFIGQNVAVGPSNIAQATDVWALEKKDFTYGGPNNFFKVGHYTQMIYAETTLIGCGSASCDAGYRIHVCNYAKSQMNWQKPYTLCTEGQADCGKLKGGFRSRRAATSVPQGQQGYTVQIARNIIRDTH